MKKLFLLLTFFLSILFIQAQTPGNALNFDGGNDYISIADAPSLKADTITVEAWVKPGGFDGYIITKPNSRGPNGAYFEDYALLMREGRFMAIMSNNGNQKVASQLKGFVPGQWYHLAAVFSPVSVSLYVNGILHQTTATGFPLDHGAFPLLMGASPNLLHFNNITIDEVNILSGSRSLSQILSDMIAPIPLSTPGLVSYYNFNLGIADGNNAAAQLLLDQGPGNLNTAPLTNFALNGSSSNWVSSYAFTIPKALPARNISNSGFTADWEAPVAANFTSYKLEVSVDSTFVSQVIFYNTTTDSLAITGLVSGYTYYYRVRADKSSMNGQGALSEIITVSLPYQSPTINSFTPVLAGANNILTIIGNHLNGTTAISFGDSSVASFTIVSPDTIKATLKVSASGNVTVTTPGGTATLGGFTFILPPLVTSFSPSIISGIGGTVTVKGKYFTSASSITFGDKPATFSIISDSEIVANVTNVGNEGNSNVKVTTFAGEGFLSGFSYALTSVTGKTIVCKGAATSLIASGLSPFTWYDDSLTGNLIHTGDTLTLAHVDAPAQYWLSSNGGSRKRISISVMDTTNIIATATPSFSGIGEAVTLKGIVPVGEIEWYTTPTGGTPFAVTPSGGNTIVRPIAATTYYAARKISKTFTPQGFQAQTYTVPADVYAIEVDMAGAQGGFGGPSPYYVGGPGGKGGRVKTVLSVTPGQVLNLFVGFYGGHYGTNGTGWNGGGKGAANGNNSGAVGGDATDIRMGGLALENRIIVAGGGGGGMSIPWYTPCDLTPLAGGGGLTAQQGRDASCSGWSSRLASGGSQTAGGKGGSKVNYQDGTDGILGQGGAAYDYSGGGGGGYYGGGAGSAFMSGGGGSSYTDPLLTQYTEHTKDYCPGNGYITLTYFTDCNQRVPVNVTMFPPPEITSFSPSVVKEGDTVIIKGVNFSYTIKSIGFGGILATSFVTVSDSVVKAVVGAATSGSIILTTLGGSDFINGLTFIPSPVVNSFSPIRADSAGTIINLSGNNLNTVSSVELDGISVPFSVVSTTSLNVTLGSGSADRIKLTNNGGSIAVDGLWHGGVPGNALSFDGANDDIIIKRPVADDFTIEYWMQTRTGGDFYANWRGANAIIDTDVPGYNNNDFGISVQYRYISAGVSSQNGSEVALNSTTQVTDGKWYHVAFTRTRSTGELKLYINGVLESHRFGPTVSLNESSILKIGGNIQSLKHYTGNLDELRFWNVAKTQAEIIAGMRTVLNGKEAGLAAYYPFDRGIAKDNNTAVSTLPDMAFAIPTAPLNNFALTGNISNWIKSYAVFNPEINTLTPLATFPGTVVTIKGKLLTETIEVKFGSVNASFTIVSDSEIVAIAPVADMSASGSITVITTAGQKTMNGITYQPAPVVTSFDPTNGVTDTTVTITGSFFSGVTAVYIGGVAASSFNVISSTRILAVIGAGATTGSVSVTSAAGTASKSGFLYSSITERNHCLKFDGANDYVRINRPVSGDFTLEYWMKTSQIGSTGVAWAHGAGLVDAEVGGVVNDFGTSLMGSKLAFGVGIPGLSDITIKSVSDVNRNEWVHVAATRKQSTGELLLYINGVLEATGTGSTSTLNSPSFMTFGAIQTINGFFNGYLDDVRIWNTVRTASEVGSDRDSKITGTEPGLVAYYNFDEGLDTAVNTIFNVLPDKTSGGNNGSLNNFALTGTNSNWVKSYAGFVPRIQSFTPNLVSSPATLVTIFGRKFSGITHVSFGNTPALSFSVESDTVIKAMIGNGAGGYVKLNGPGGRDSLGSMVFEPVPVFNSFSPLNGGTGVSVTLSGRFLTTATAISIGGVPVASFTALSDTVLVAVVDSGASLNDTVRITTTFGSSAMPGFVHFASPVISSFNPAAAPTGTTIIIRGRYFSTTTSVTIAGVPAVYSVISDSVIEAKVSSGTTDSIKVTTFGGTIFIIGFSYIPPPKITYLFPASGIVGDTIRVYGKYFTGTSQVKLGGTLVTNVLVQSDSLMTIIAPYTVSGNLVITATGGTVTRTGFFYGTKVGNALKFDGVNDYVSIVDAAALRPSTLTLEAWVKPEAADGWIVFKPNTIPNYDHGLQAYSILMSGGKFHAIMTNRSTYNRSVVSQSESYIQGVWYHVAAVFSSTSVSLYVNGIFQQSLATGFPIDYSNDPITIGAHARLNSFTNCTIDELRLFNTDRSPYIYNDMLTDIAPNTNGLVASYTFNQGVAGGINTFVTSLSDYSINQQNGTLANFSLTGVNSNWVNSAAMKQPRITSLSAAAVTPGSTIYITGANLSDATSVSFGGIEAQSYTVDSDSSITAVLGAGATGIVKVVSEGGVGVLGGFTALIPPNISTFTPLAGGPGTIVNITGTQFAGVTAVSFGGVPATSFTVNSITSITAVVAGGANGAISVTTGAGIATRPGFSFYDLPSLTSFTPQTMFPGGIIQIKGTNFLSAIAVQTGGVNVASFVIVSDTLITAEIATNSVSGNVSVTTVSGNASLAGFAFIAPPAIRIFSPTNGVANTVISIRGNRLLNTTAVSFGNIPAASFTVLNDSMITAIVSASATSGKVSITTSDFGTISRDGFWFGLPPGNALKFQRTRRSFVVIPDAPQQKSPLMTFEFWFKPNIGSSTLFGKGNMAVEFVSNRLVIKTPSSSQQGYTILNDTAKWHHVGVVVDTYSQYAYIMLDGQYEVDQYIDASWAGTGPFYLGTGGSGYAASFTMDEFRIYNTDRYYELESGIDAYRSVNLNDSALVGYYSFDHGVANGNNSGSTFLNDLSQYHNDGILDGTYNSSVSLFTLSGTSSNWVSGGHGIAPEIISFSPDTTYTDSLVTIRGYGFTNVTYVELGGASCPFMFISDSVITAVVSASSVSGEVKLHTSVGSGTPAADYYNIGEATRGGLTIISQSVITSFTPVNAKQGTTVTINGTNLNLVTAVSFGGVPAASFSLGSTSSMTAVVHTGATGSVSVTNTFGSTSSMPGFTFFVPPVISSFAPAIAKAGDAITIRGNHFTGTTSVTIGGSLPISYTVISDTIITAIIGANTSGNIVVSTPGGIDSATGFTIVKFPFIFSFTPGFSAPGGAVVIHGFNFNGTSDVRFGGTPAASYTVTSDTTIVAYVGIGSSGLIQVTTSEGTATASGFVFYPTPAIASFTPINASAGSTISIKGTGFTGTTNVSFGASAASSFTVMSDTLITAILGSGSTGSVRVITIGGTATRSGFTFTAPPNENVTPVITHSTTCNNPSLVSASVTGVVITDASGINNTTGTKPRLYYKKKTDANTINGNTSATTGWKYAEANGTTSPFDFTIDYSKLFGTSIATGDTLQYFVVAQDMALVANIAITGGTFAIAPTSVNLASANLPTSVLHTYFVGNITPAVTISASQTTICQGSNITFNTSTVLAGSSPLFQWKKNGNTIATGASYTTSTLTDQDIISCVMTSNYATTCPVASYTPASNAITVNVNPTYSITNPQIVCAGTNYSFNGHAYSTAGTYRDTLHTTRGCDSIIVTQLNVNPVYSVNNSQTICAGKTYLFNSHNYSVAGTYRDTLHSVTGCDSIIVTQLFVNPIYTTNNPQTICSVGSYLINGHTYTTAGTYRDTLVAATGCDSIIVTQLNVSPTFTVNTTQTICFGSSYDFNGHTYTTAGTYRDTLGCTIIVTQLTVNGGNTFNNFQTICSGKSYTINAHTYTIAGTYRDTLHTGFGCDSFVVTQLTVNPNYTTNNPQTICSGTSYSFNGHAYSVAGNYNDTLHSVTGCDSIIVTQLNVNPIYSVNNSQTICAGTSYSFNGHVYAVAGNYNDTLHSVTGCDSIIVTQLNVNPVYSVNNPQAICAGSNYSFNGNVYSAAGTYRDTLHSATGCDSIIVTQLFVNPVYTVNNPQTICNGTNYSFNGNVYVIAGTYRDTLHSSTGCDSIIVTQLLVNPVYTVNNPQTICAGSSYSFNGHTYAVAGNYNDTLHSVTGCDSIIVTQLNIIPVYSINNPQTICAGTSYSFNGHTYAVAGNYNDTLHSATGCDSIIVTQLNVNPVYSVNNPQTICEGSNYSFNGNVYAVAGIYRDTLVSVTGCDSIIVTQLMVNPVYTVNNAQTICEGRTYAFNGHQYSVAGTYRDTLHTALGCDSFVVTQLTVNPTYAVNNLQTICAGTSYSFNGHTYSVAGNYNDTLHSVTGCDSIITTQLSINAAPIATATAASSTTFCYGGSVVINANIESGLAYHWLQNNAVIPLATADNYIATTTGNYRVITTNGNGCSDTSTAVVVSVNPKPSTSAISGAASPQINSFEAYSVANTVGSTYQWIVTNGTLISGGNSNLIVVRWGATVGGASVKVIETNSTGCKGDTILQNTNLALPVKLISFTGTKEKADIVLKWSTASELNNDYFIVQRSTDGKQFENIGTVKGNGTTNNLSNYNYVDLSTNQHINQSTIFYRLKQVDIDGKFEYSKTIVVNQPIANGQQLTANVFPNPFATQTTLNIHSAIATQATLHITDANGKVVTEKQVELYEGETIVDLTDFANSNLSGVYVVQIITATDMVTQRIMKAK